MRLPALPRHLALCSAAALALAGGLAPPAGAQAAPAGPDLGFGSSGPAVQALQEDLLALGYRITGTADGDFGATTWEGLVFFQRDHDLYPGGDTTPATWRALRTALGSAPFGSVPLAAGAAGPAVGVLQGDLRQLGYYAGTPGGTFGPATGAALLRFQAGHGLPATGVLDRATAVALAAAVGVPGYDPADPPPPRFADGLAPPAPAATPAPAAPAHPAVLAYWAVWGNDAAALSSLEAHASQIRWLSPYWYTLEPDGTLRSRESDHAQVLQAAAQGGVAVLPLINDAPGVAGLLGTASGLRAAVGAVAALLAANQGYAGVMIDFESMPASAGAELTALVRDLRAALPARDIVGVAVGPEVEADEPGEGLYQYAALGAAADLVQIMTYDDHDGASAPGPISPTSWVQRVLDYAVTAIPPSKILLGVPAYGYDWAGAGDGSTVSVPQAGALAAAEGVTPVPDPAAGEDTFQYTGPGGVLHTVWYESPAGVLAKEQLASSLGLGGLALWTIGSESPAFWPALAGSPVP